MRIGVGLPSAIPNADFGQFAEWAHRSESAGFQSIGVLDRLVYESLDPLIALAGAATVTKNVQLITAVLNVPYRANGVLLAKQLSSVDQLAGGRLLAGLALGGWQEDAATNEAARTHRGKAFEAMLDQMDAVWEGLTTGQAGPMVAAGQLPPRLLFGGLASASFERAAKCSDGWLAPFFGQAALVSGVAAVRGAWQAAGRVGQPRIVTARYFSLGPTGGELADDYLRHYYGAGYFGLARQDTVTNAVELDAMLGQLADAGCDDVVFFPCSDDLAQLSALTDLVQPVRV